MILLFTDFGADGPYLAQMEAVLRRSAPGAEVLNLLSNAPSADPLRSSYLLAALCRYFPEGSVFLTIVDPGVGGGRLPVVLEADRRCFVGPDNGLLNGVAKQAGAARWRRIDWRPEALSASFHGRDLFAPIAARVAAGDWNWPGADCPGPDLSAWPADLAEIIYVDHYGNAITGIRDRSEWADLTLNVSGQNVLPAYTFSSVPEGEAFWYRNSMDLVEIAVNRGRAADVLGLKIGTPVSWSAGR